MSDGGDGERGQRDGLDRLEELVEQGDLDELLREIDRRCDRRDWDGLVALRDRCRRAIERGRQLWPAAHHAEYRLALEAPGPWAGAVLVEGAGRFALGPLSEVAASTHTWAELAQHAPPGPVRALAAHERVVRGEDLRGESIEPPVLDLPLVLQHWEPAYEVAHYEAHRADFPMPAVPPIEPVGLPQPGDPADEPDGVAALLDLVRAWTEESGGRARAVAVEGDALDAIAALGPPEARVGRCDPMRALALMAWAGSSGGARGRRRGAAAGRFAAWWTAAALAGLLDAWPVDPDELGGAIAELRWFVWDERDHAKGWRLHLAAHDPANRLAWALGASDTA